MDKRTKHKVRSSYATVVNNSQVNSIDKSEYDIVKEFDMSVDDDQSLLKFYNSHGGSESDLCLVIKNFHEADDKRGISEKLKAFWESRSFSGDTITDVFITGNESPTEYNTDLHGRVFNIK